MAEWTEIKKDGNEISFKDGTPMLIGQNFAMGQGSIELRDTKKAGLHIVRLSKNGHFKYFVKLRKDGSYRLGPDYGHRVIPPEEETDPIKRILREMNIPVSVLEETTVTQIEIDEWYGKGHGLIENHWLHDGDEVGDPDNQYQHNGYIGRRGYNTFTVSNASYAIRIDVGQYMNGCEWVRVGQVMVWPNCDPKELAEKLTKILGEK